MLVTTWWPCLYITLSLSTDRIDLNEYYKQIFVWFHFFVHVTIAHKEYKKHLSIEWECP